MSKKYSQMIEATTLGNDDLFAVAQSGVSKKIKKSTFFKESQLDSETVIYKHVGADINQTNCPFPFRSPTDNITKIKLNRLEQYLGEDYTITMPNLVNWINQTIIDGNIISYRKF
jgi:hypothetical protein